MKGSSSRLTGWALAAVLLCATLTAAAATNNDKKVKVTEEPKMQRVYMLGFAISFKDSVACVTEIQPIDSAYLDAAHHFLLDRSLYSLQLQIHMERAGYKNAICNVFFDKKPMKLQRVLRKIHKRYERDASFHLKDLPVGEFRFKAEEYRPVLTEEETP